MKKFNSYACGVVSCYNSIVCAADNQRQMPKVDERQLIDAYSSALQVLSDMHYMQIIDNSEFCRKADLLHLCIDCPTTHVVPCVELVVRYLT